MFRLYRLEMQKHLPHISFWVMMGLYSILMPLFTWRITTIQNNKLLESFFSFPDIWETSVYFASFFNFFLGFIIIGRVTNEFSFRTIRQQIMDGMSRMEAIGAKVMLVLTLAVWAVILVALSSIILGVLGTPNMADVSIFEKSINLLYFFIHALGYMLLAMLVGFFIKRSGLAYILFFFTWIAELIITARLKVVADWLPYQAFDNLIFKIYQDFTEFAGIEVASNFNLWLPILYIFLFIAITYLYFRRVDL